MKLRFNPSATKELRKSADWYADRSEQAARRFAAAIRKALSAIDAAPERFPLVSQRERACSVEKFPFQLIFRVSGDVLYIVAVAHAKRRPGYWKHRK